MKLSDSQKAQVVQHLFKGNKIEAIKYFRQISGYGLKESKDVIDMIDNSLRSGKNVSEIELQFEQSEYFENDSSNNDQSVEFTSSETYTENSSYQPKVLNQNEIIHITTLINNGKKIEAVKIIREKLGLGLKEAYELAKEYEKRNADNQSLNKIRKNEQKLKEKKHKEKKARKDAEKKGSVIRQERIFRDDIISEAKIPQKKKKSGLKKNSGCMLVWIALFTLGSIILYSGIQIFS